MNQMRKDFEAAMESMGDPIPEDDSIKNEVLTTEYDDAEQSEAAEETAEQETPVEATTDDGGEGRVAEGEADPVEAKAPIKDEIKPPVGYSPESREEWKNVPQAVKAQIHKREQDIAKAMEGTAVARRSHQQLGALANTYGSVLAAEGVQHPMQAVENLFKTVAELRMGSPAQKAQKMAQLIEHYGVDIGALDTALTGQTPVDPQSSQFEQLLDQRMAPINQVMEQLTQLQAGKQQQTQQAAMQEVETFKQTAEFLDDVRNDMADLIDMAANRGYDMSMQEAYDKACALNPQISAIMKQRADAAALVGNSNSIAAKRSASSSISGSPNSAGSMNRDTSIRGLMSRAWDEAAGG